MCVGTIGLQFQRRARLLAQLWALTKVASLWGEENTARGRQQTVQSSKRPSRGAFYLLPHCICSSFQFILKYYRLRNLMLSAPNLILLSYTARADLLETGFLMCYGTGSGRGYSLMEAESTHRHNLHILSLGAPLLGMSCHTRWRLPGELGVSARGIRWINYLIAPN